MSIFPRPALVFLLAVMTSFAVNARELYLYNWEDFMDPGVLKDFERETGIKVIEDNFASNEELLAKLQAGGGGYDLIVPSDYMVAIMARQGLLARLDHANLPNLVNLEPRFRQLPFDPGNAYSVAYFWGVTGIGYNKALVSRSPESWRDLFGETSLARYKGRISMLNDMREVIGAALISLGHSPNSTDEQALAAAKQLLITQKASLAKYDSETFEESVAAGELAMTQGWSGEFFTAMVENPDVAFVVPREGTLQFVDNLAIPANSKNKRDAESLIDFLLRPDIAARIANHVGYPTPNRAARDKLDPASPGANFVVPEAVPLYSLEDLGDRGATHERIWTEIKAR